VSDPDTTDGQLVLDMPGPLPGEAIRGQWIDKGVTGRAVVRIALGIHPLECVATGLKLHPDAVRDPDDRTTGPRCGGCLYATPAGWHNRRYRKCSIGMPPGGTLDDAPRAAHSEASDLRMWWPACRDYQPKETT
jgi:hypothetical protein